MYDRFARTVALLGLALMASTPRPVKGTGLYSNLPWWFSPADTARVCVLTDQTWIRTEQDDATLLTFETVIRTGDRTSARLGLMYPVLRRSGGFEHGLGDATVGVEVRAAGDTLNRSGIFLRTDLRLPSGPSSLWPFSLESIDGGVGIEARHSYGPFDLRGSASGFLAGRRERTGERRHENYAQLAAAIRIEPLPRTEVALSVFSQLFRGGGYREVYLLSLGVRASERFHLRLCGGVDSGEPSDRVFNSLVQFSILSRFTGAPPPPSGTGSGPGMP